MSASAYAPGNNGIKTTNCYIGTGIFAGIALVVSIVMTVYVNSQTKDRSQVGTNMK